MDQLRLLVYIFVCLLYFQSLIFFKCQVTQGKEVKSYFNMYIYKYVS